MTDAVVARAQAQGRWFLAAEATTRVMEFFKAIVLARLLLPEHFGAVTLAAAIWEWLALFGNVGVNETIIRKRGAIHELSTTLFWLNSTFRIALALVAVAFSFAVAHFYADPLLIPFISLLALSSVFGQLCAVHGALLYRNMAFKRLAFTDTSCEVLRAVLSIALALAGYGAWSLVLPVPAVEALRAILLWSLQPWRPDLDLRRQGWRRVFSYSRYLLGSGLLNHVCMNAGYLVVGSAFGQATLGIYMRGFRFALFLVESGAWLIPRMTLPTLAALQDDAERMADVFAKILRSLCIVSIPAAAILFVNSYDAIAVLYGEERWGAAAPLARILLAFAVVRAIGSVSMQALLAIGRARDIFLLQVASIGPVIAAIVAGTRFGIGGVASAVTVVLGTMFVLVAAHACRVVGVGLIGAMRALLPGAAVAAATLGGAIVAAAAAPALLEALVAAHSRFALQAFRLALSGATGAVAGWLCLWLGYREDHDRLLRSLGVTAVLSRWRSRGTNGQR